MRPNLSLTNIASTLAVLGTSAVLLACGGGDKPAASPAGATDVTASPTKAGQGSCSANGCGANAKGGDTTKPADGAASGSGATATATTPPPATTPAVATPDPKDTKTATTTPPPATATAAAKPPAPKPAAAPGGKPTGQASCGAGTCGTDTKKK